MVVNVNRWYFFLGSLAAAAATQLPLTLSIAQSNLWALKYQSGPEKFTARAVDVLRQMQNMPQHANCRCVLYWKDETYDVGRGEWPSA
jgi:hypothetical protein